MSSEHGLPPAPDAISEAEWHAVSNQESDTTLVLDADGVCTWTSGVPWVGRAFRDVIAASDAATLDLLLGSEPRGPLWLRRPESAADVSWVHAVSVPRAEGGWVIQIRQARSVDARLHRDVVDLDVVTGVAGRQYALNELAFLLAASPRTGKETAVAYCGLDDLAGLTERLGAEVCDEVLRVVAGRISDTLRSGDLVARLDADSFIVVLRGVHHLRGAMRVANKVRAMVEDPIPLASGDVDQTISVGVTIVSRGESVESVLERAEGALAMAREAGRNLVISSPPI